MLVDYSNINHTHDSMQIHTQQDIETIEMNRKKKAYKIEIGLLNFFEVFILCWMLLSLEYSHQLD